MGLHCETCRCGPTPKGRYGFVVDNQRFDTDEEYVSLYFILAHAHWVHGRQILWMRDGLPAEEVDAMLPNGHGTRLFSTGNTPRFLTVPPATF